MSLFCKKSQPVQPVAPFEMVDCIDLLHEEYEPLQWVIPEYLPEGLTLLFSRPKVGKSMLSLALSLRMARRVSGGMDGEVLYLSLDDTNKRRLQSRVRSLLQGEEIERQRLYFATKAETLDAGLIEQFEQWMKDHQKTRLIVLDVYARVKPRKQNDDVYKSDYDALCKLQEFAIQYHLAILLVHHTRKQRDTEDWLDNVNGSTGLTAAVDTIWMVERQPGTNRLRLRIKSREELLTPGELIVNLTLDDLDAPWKLRQRAGEDGDDELPEEPSDSEQRILDVLQHSDTGVAPKYLAELAQMNHATVRKALRRMMQKKLVMQTAYGNYKVATNFATLARVANEYDPSRQATPEEWQEWQSGTHENFATLANEASIQAASQRVATNLRKSDAPCHSCGGSLERLQLGQWVCWACHPNPFAKEAG